MMNFGAKLHININDIIATIKRGLLHYIRIQVMMINKKNPRDLLLKATLAESFHAHATPATRIFQLKQYTIHTTT